MLLLNKECEAVASFCILYRTAFILAADNFILLLNRQDKNSYLFRMSRQYITVICAANYILTFVLFK